MSLDNRILFFLAFFVVASADINARANDAIDSPALNLDEVASEEQEHEVVRSVISPERNETGYWPYNINTRAGVRLQGISGAPPVYIDVKEEHSSE